MTSIEIPGIINKQIHADELKLRLLMTDGCNRDCSFCLNDFQPKPKTKDEIQYLNPGIAMTAIKQYAESFRGRYPLQVYFSGGEPSMHPNLVDVMRFAKLLDCRVTLNTNGDFPSRLEPKLMASSDIIHFGTYEKNSKRAEKIKRMNGLVQTVYPHIDLSFVEFYSGYGIPIKIFQDFYDTSNGYERFCGEMKKKFPNADLSFRYTGVQENRGHGCDGCQKTCCTLKAAWVFPDGGSSPCPQLPNSYRDYPKSFKEWSEHFERIEKLHRKEKSN